MMKKTSIFLFLLLVCLFMGVESVLADINVVQIETNYGTITVELYPDEAPISVANFLSYVNRGFYDGLIFHRVIDEFMIQTGAYDPNLYDFLAGNPDISDPNWVENPLFYREPNEPIINEADNGLLNLRGALAMARTSDPDSATSQFYINQMDNPTLNPGSGTAGYAVFGRVIDGLSIVDDIAQVPTHAANLAFQDLPDDPVILIQVEEIMSFDANSVDFNEIPYLKAADGTVRTFSGQGAKLDLNYTHTFTAVSYLGIDCLQWEQTADDGAGIDDFTMVLAREKSGQMWVYKYVINEGEDDEEIIIEAESLVDGVSFEEFAEENMQFRLILDQFNPDNLSDPNNTFTLGSGDDAETWTIVSTDATLVGTEGDLIEVKYFVGDEGAPSETDWIYYSEELGLVLDLLDDTNDPDGDGWRLAPMNFDNTSTDLSEIPFLHVTVGEEFIQTYVGQGGLDDINYTHTFTPSEDPFNGVDYVIWEQDGLENEGIDSFTLHSAKDINDELWVFYYELNDAVLIEAEKLLEATRLSDLDDAVLFRLISGTIDLDNFGDPNNIVTGGGFTEQIMSVTDTVEHIPHYRGELIRVEKYEDIGDPNHEVFYYHETKGLILNLRNGTNGADGDGWVMAFYGADFGSNSDDFSDIPFLMAKLNTVRRYFGRGGYEDYSFDYEYTTRAHLSVDCMKWERTKVDDVGLVNFYLYLARDTMDQIWVFRYAIDGPLVFSASTIFDARPLSEFDDVMFFRLISGTFDPNFVGSDLNHFIDAESNPDVLHQILSFAGTLDYLPSLNEELVLEKVTPQVADPNVGWRYFDESVGLVLQLDNTAEDFSDPNFYDPNDTTSPPGDLTGWVLGWYGEPPPDFDFTSDDFAEVDFVSATNQDVRMYQGQGDFAGTNFRVIYSSEKVFDVECLGVEETAIVDPIRAGMEMLLGKDTNDNTWLFRARSAGSVVFEAGRIHEIIPAEQYPDMFLRLLSGDFEEGTTITTGAGAEQQREEVIRLEESLARFADFDDELVLGQWLGGDPADEVSWSYYHDSAGLVLQLWPDGADPNSYDPNLIDADGAGWILTEPNLLEDLQISLKAGKSRETASDSFTLQGNIPQAEMEDFAHTDLFISVGPWQMTIDTSADEFQRLGSKDMFKYKGSPDGTAVVSLVIDLRKHKKFKMAASRVNLSGMDEPIKVSLVAGNYFGGGAADVFKNKKPPIEFFRGDADKLRFKNYLFTYNNGPNAFNSYNLTLHGEIATAVYPVDLTGKEVTINWGDKEFVIPAIEEEGDNGLDRVRNLEKFVYRTSSGALRSVTFDLAKGKFKMTIRKTNLALPPQTLTIKFEIEEGVFFEQNVTVI